VRRSSVRKVEAMEPEQFQAKFRGSLLGVAVGDALGAPFEGTRAITRRGDTCTRRQGGKRTPNGRSKPLKGG